MFQKIGDFFRSLMAQDETFERVEPPMSGSTRIWTEEEFNDKKKRIVSGPRGSGRTFRTYLTAAMLASMGETVVIFHTYGNKAPFLAKKFFSKFSEYGFLYRPNGSYVNKFSNGTIEFFNLDTYERYRTDPRIIGRSYKSILDS